MATSQSSTPSTRVPNDRIKLSPLRVLILTPSRGSASNTTLSPFPPFLQQLTNTSPPTDLTTFAGYTTHSPLHLRTKYYEKNVGIWCDELPTPLPAQRTDQTGKDEMSLPPSSADSDATLQTWQSQMLSAEASEVRDVIGSIILLLPYNSTTLPSGQLSSTLVSQAEQRPSQISTWINYIEAITALRDAIEDQSGRDVGLIAVLQDTSQSVVVSVQSISASQIQSDSGDSSVSPNSREAPTTNQKVTDQLLGRLEDTALGVHGFLGWDFVSWTPMPSSASNPPDLNSNLTNRSEETRNSFGEKTGFSRIVEVLQGTDWTAGPSSFEDDDGEMKDISKAVDKVSQHEPNDTEFNELFDFLDDVDININDDGLVRDPSPGGSLTRNMVGSTTEREGLLRQQRLQSDGNEEDRITDGEDIQIEQLTSLMSRVVAIKEAAESMSGDARERFAKREISRIMKEL